MIFNDVLGRISESYALKNTCILLLFSCVVFFMVFVGCTFLLSFGINSKWLFVAGVLVCAGIYILQGYTPFSFLKKPTIFAPYQVGSSGLIAFTFPVFLCVFLCISAVYSSAESSLDIAEYNKEFSAWLLSSPFLKGIPIQKYEVLDTAQIVTYVIPWAAAVLLSIIAFPIITLFAVIEEWRTDSEKNRATNYFYIMCALMGAYITYDAGFAGMDIVADGAPKPIQTASGPAYIQAPDTNYGFGDYYDKTDLIEFSMNGLMSSAFLVCFLPVMLAMGVASAVSLLKSAAFKKD